MLDKKLEIQEHETVSHAESAFTRNGSFLSSKFQQFPDLFRFYTSIDTADANTEFPDNLRFGSDLD